MNLFQLAVKHNYIFQTTSGSLNVIDLYTLPLTHTRSVNLNSIAKSIASEIKENEAESFISTKSYSDKVLENKLELLKLIIADKLNEDSEKILQKEKQQKSQAILSIIEEKQQEILKSKSIEELKKLL